jgi:NAD(P)H-hydrate epimerase
MKAITLDKSLPQPVFDANQLLQNEAKVAKKMNITMYYLMEQAGEAVFEHIQQAYSNTKEILVIAGKGNNGGDGFVVARLAQQANISVRVLLVVSPDELQGDAKTAYLHYIDNKGQVILFDQQAPTYYELYDFEGEIIVDALFGIGLKGQLSNHLSSLVDVVNRHAAKVVSIDVPSGLSASTGQVNSVAIIADSTVTFIALKKGLLTGQAANYIGELFFASLNSSSLSMTEQFSADVPTTMTIEGANLLSHLPKRLAASHKGDVGLLLAIGGNKGMAGAIRLSAEAALRSGAALVSVCCAQENQILVVSGRPELMLASDSIELLQESTAMQKAKVFVIGPGLGHDLWAEKLFELVVTFDKPCVVDADALQLLAKKNIKKSHWVLTPHPGEAAALLHCTVAEIEADRYAAVKHIAQQYGGLCILKGSGSLISDGENVWINSSGNSGMASGGMGDVLSGIIAALLMQLSDQPLAVRLAVYIHGRAADIIAQHTGQIGMLASDLIPVVQRLMNDKQ